MSAPDILALGGREDDELIEAERQLTLLRGQRDALPIEDEKGDVAISNQIFEMYETISRTQPISLSGAAVKLRLLLDPHLGIDIDLTHDDYQSLRQISDLIEREVRRTPAP